MRRSAGREPDDRGITRVCDPLPLSVGRGGSAPGGPARTSRVHDRGPADLESARAFIGPESYYRAGLFASVVIERVRPMTPPYDGAPRYEQLAVERARRG